MPLSRTSEGNQVSLSDLLAGLRRRWYAAVFGLLLTVGFALAALHLVPVQYEANSAVLLVPPTSTVGAGGNPYLALGGLQGAADVVARAMTGEAISDEIAPPGGPASYTFEVDATSSAPMLVIKTQDKTAAGALGTLSRLLAKAPQVLLKLQAEVGAPTKSLISVGPITQDTVPTVNRKSQTRAVVVAGVLGIALLLFGTNLLDGFLVRRSVSRDEALTSVPRNRILIAPEHTGPRMVESVEASGDSRAGPDTTAVRARSLRLRPSEGNAGADAVGRNG